MSSIQTDLDGRSLYEVEMVERMLARVKADHARYINKRVEYWGCFGKVVEVRFRETTYFPYVRVEWETKPMHASEWISLNAPIKFL
jgi:hypothetical protein